MRTLWWYLLVGIAALNVLWSLVGVLAGETITFGPATLWVIFGGSFLVLTPIFFLALYQELTTLRNRRGSWMPDPRLWVGGGGVLSVLGAVMFLNPMTHYVAAIYLIQRVRKMETSKSFD